MVRLSLNFRNSLFPTSAGLLLTLAMVAAAPCAEPAVAGRLADWYMHTGNGTFTSPRLGLRLVDNYLHARLLWENETHTGVGKTSSRGASTLVGFAQADERPDYFNGGACSPIVADSTVIPDTCTQGTIELIEL